MLISRASRSTIFSSKCSTELLAKGKQVGENSFLKCPPHGGACPRGGGPVRIPVQSPPCLMLASQFITRNAVSTSPMDICRTAWSYNSESNEIGGWLDTIHKAAAHTLRYLLTTCMRFTLRLRWQTDTHDEFTEMTANETFTDAALHEKMVPRTGYLNRIVTGPFWQLVHP